MSVTNWIFLGLIIVAFVLLIISYIKKIIVLQKTCECLILPLAATLITLWLTESLPDSFHIIVITVTAFALISLSGFFLAFETVKTLLFAGRLSSIANLLCWCVLYEPIFRIHSVPVWLWIICSTFYIAVIITCCILSGKQSLLFYFLFAAAFSVVAFLHFCALMFLCYERTIASLLLFAGASLSTGLITFHFLNQTKLKTKHAGVIRYSLLVASQILIACSNILLIR